MNKWDRRMMEIAKTVATWSKDPDNKVGAVLTTLDNRILATGYNGYPAGIDYMNKKDKLFSTIHAEVNAILQARTRPDRMQMFVTRHPCAQCAAIMVQAGVSTVVTYPIETLSSWYTSMQVANEIFIKAKVRVIHL